MYVPCFVLLCRVNDIIKERLNLYTHEGIERGRKCIRVGVWGIRGWDFFHKVFYDWLQDRWTFQGFIIDKIP